MHSCSKIDGKDRIEVRRRAVLEAQRLNHHTVDVDHLFLGAIRAGAKIMDLQEACRMVEERKPKAPDAVLTGLFPLTETATAILMKCETVDQIAEAALTALTAE